MDKKVSILFSLFIGITIGAYASSIDKTRDPKNESSTDFQRQPFEPQGPSAKPQPLNANRSDQDLISPPAGRGSTRKEIKAAAETTTSFNSQEIEAILDALGPDWATPIPGNANAVGKKVSGVPHGEWLLHYIHDTREIIDSGAFVLGARVGEWTITDSSGNVLRTRSYVNGKIEGVMQDRTSVNDVWRQFHYVHGVLQ